MFHSRDHLCYHPVALMPCRVGVGISSAGSGVSRHPAEIRAHGLIQVGQLKTPGESTMAELQRRGQVAP